MKTPPKKTRTTEEKQGYMGEHLYYEVKMLIYTTKSINGETNRFRVNALLESNLIHARGIYNFLFNDKKRRPNEVEDSDDAISLDYVRQSDEIDYKRERDALDKNRVKDLKTRVGSEVAHLSYSRLDVRNKNWDIEMQTDLLLKAIKIFLKYVDKQYKKDKLEELLQSNGQSKTVNTQPLIMHILTGASTRTTSSSSVGMTDHIAPKN